MIQVADFTALLGSLAQCFPLSEFYVPGWDRGFRVEISMFLKFGYYFGLKVGIRVSVP